MLSWSLYSTFLGAVALLVLPARSAGLAKWLALLTGLVALGCALLGAAQFTPGQLQTLADCTWIPSLGIRYHLAADGISVTLVILTGLATVAGILFSWNVEQNPRAFFILYLVLVGAVYGVFLSFDAFLLFVFYEIAIIPKYFLIAKWGSTRREYGAMKLALYSFAGSAMVLAGLVAAFVLSGSHSMSLLDLANHSYPRSFQLWAFPMVFTGFAILAGLWPFHTWAPTGHVAAPTAASMLLAGVVMKLGAYGCLRVAMTVFSEGLDNWAHPVLGLGSWRDVFTLLAVIGIVYGGMVALVQQDFKFVIGYSSVSHMGFVLLGLMALNRFGLGGAVLQMFSHGIIAGLLFAVVGRMVYDRAHTRDLGELEALRLSRSLPFAAVIFTLASMASMGLPGFSGFIAELQVLLGAWQNYPTLTVVAGFGVLVGVAYTLRALQKAFFSGAQSATERESTCQAADWKVRAPNAQTGLIEPSSRTGQLQRISLPERLGAVLLLAVSVVIGLYPRCLLDLIVPSFAGSLFEGLRKVSAW